MTLAQYPLLLTFVLFWHVSYFCMQPAGGEAAIEMILFQVVVRGEDSGATCTLTFVFDEFCWSGVGVGTDQ